MVSRLLPIAVKLKTLRDMALSYFSSDADLKLLDNIETELGYGT